MRRTHTHGKAIALAILFMTLGASVFAFTFMPMSVSISPTGAQSIASFRLTNEGSQQIAVTIKAMTRAIDENGVESNTPADKDFTIFPTRVVIQPNSFQNIKVQYKGAARLSQEQSYRIIAEQVPIDFNQQQSSGVKVLFRYIAALYVTPPGVNFKISIPQVAYMVKDGAKGFLVTIVNSGTRHALINDPVVRITAPGPATITLEGDSTKSLQGQNLLAGSTRVFFFPSDKAAQGANYSASLSATVE